MNSLTRALLPAMLLGGACAACSSTPSEGLSQFGQSLAAVLSVQQQPAGDPSARSPGQMNRQGAQQPLQPQRVAQASEKPSAPSIRASTLAGIFTKHPYDGTPKSHFPRVAVTLHDWARSDCWVASATIWWNKAKSEQVAPFSICWSDSLEFAINNAAGMHMFMQQSAIDENSGNVRGKGPRPPMMAIPDRIPIREDQQNAWAGFLQQLVVDTGWAAGAPTNMWIVGFEPAKK